MTAKWSLRERPGHLRLHTLPATDFWCARNTLTQRSVGPVSSPIVQLDAAGLQNGDYAGLALLNLPWLCLGVRRRAGVLELVRHDRLTGEVLTATCPSTRIWLRADCDFFSELATTSFSRDGVTWTRLGGEFPLVFQLKTFQGVRYALFAFNTLGVDGGHADFTAFMVDQPRPQGRMHKIPGGRFITITTVGLARTLTVEEGRITGVATTDALARGLSSRFLVEDLGRGRIALRQGDALVSVTGTGLHGHVILAQGPVTDAETFQWTETVYGDLMLLSLTTHRHLRIDPVTGAVTADEPGAHTERIDGSAFTLN